MAVKLVITDREKEIFMHLSDTEKFIFYCNIVERMNQDRESVEQLERENDEYKTKLNDLVVYLLGPKYSNIKNPIDAIKNHFGEYKPSFKDKLIDIKNILFK